MGRWVDCRRCRFFTRVEELDEGAVERALAWLSRRRPGARLLGWCGFYMRPVTYYEGYCRGFEPVPETPPGVVPLSEFMG